MPDDKIKIKDTRSHIPVTKKLHSEIDRDKLMDIITAAIKKDVNPYTAIAIGMRESNLGSKMEDYYGSFTDLEYKDRISKAYEFRDDIQNKYNVILPQSKSVDDESYYPSMIQAEKQYGTKTIKSALDKYWALDANAMQRENELQNLTPEQMFVDNLKFKTDYAKKLGYKDELMQIQGYNGYGYNESYKANMKDNPIYAKDVLDIRENVIKKNTTVNDMIGEAMKDSMLMKLQEPMAEPPKFNF